jgi:hypothetical protein
MHPGGCPSSPLPIDIEANDVAGLGGELRIVGQLEGADVMRGQAVGSPDLLHRGQAHARHLGHQSAGPARRLALLPARRNLS